MAKYKTITELAAAFKKKKLSQHHFLRLDKGGSQVCLDYHDEFATESLNQEKSNECIDLYDPEYGGLIDEALTALGIPFEWA